MPRNMSRVVPIWGILFLFTFTGNASAQWYPGSNICNCAQQVAQACYRTVPVTEYRRVRQTVQQPVVDTKWVSKEFTEYRPVVEAKTADVPTVAYENVTELRTVQRNMGYWATQYRHRPTISPWQYDRRPGLFGWLNRTGYSVRSTFTPRVTSKRQYVPQVVTQQIPVTRQVARHGTRKITYNVTHMVPHKTTRKVQVRTVRWVSKEIVRTQPVTVMRTLPIGSSLAYSPYGIGGSQTVLLPRKDPISQEKSSRQTFNKGNKYDNDPEPRKLEEDSGRFDFEPSGENNKFNEGTSLEPRESLLPAESVRRVARPTSPQVGRRIRVPSIVRVNRWTARGQRAAGPALISPSISVAGSEESVSQ